VREADWQVEEIVQSRFRIDGVPIDHMQSASDTGVMSWVTSGRLDLVADIRFPREESNFDLPTLVADLVDDLTDRLREGASGATGERIPGRSSLSKDALKVPSESVHSTSREGFKEKEREERKKAMRFAKAVKTTSDEEEIMRKLEQDQLDEEEEEEDKIVSIDLDLRFKDLKAHVPVSFAPPRPSLPSLTFLEIYDPHKTDYSEWFEKSVAFF